MLSLVVDLIDVWTNTCQFGFLPRKTDRSIDTVGFTTSVGFTTWGATMLQCIHLSWFYHSGRLMAYHRSFGCRTRENWLQRCRIVDDFFQGSHIAAVLCEWEESFYFEYEYGIWVSYRLQVANSWKSNGCWRYDMVFELPLPPTCCQNFRTIFKTSNTYCMHVLWS